MEPIAVNRITITRDLFEEGQMAFFSRQRKKMLLSSGVVFLIFGFILLAVQMRLPDASMLAFPALLSGVIVMIWALTLEKSEMRRKFSAFRRKYGETSPRTITCYDSCLLVDTGSGEPLQIDYPDILANRETAHLCLLTCKDHTGVMLARDGFTQGSWEALLSAIEEAKAAALEEAKLLGM